jgi:membrane-bound lytic murein transglycosylase A
MHSSRLVIAASAALAAVVQLTRTGRAFAQVFVRGLLAILVGVILCCAANAALAEEPLKLADSQLEPAKWADLVGWKADDHLAAFAAYDTSCQALRKRQGADGGQISRALRNVCRKAMGSRPQDSYTARAFFEQNFQPVRIARLGETQGFLTGYYEPVVQGSRFPNPEFHVPVYRRPPDLVAVGYKPGSKAFPNKGTRIGRRNEQNQIVPYYDRGAIEAGALDGQKLEICWLKDPFDLLAIQIEGSGRVILEDGTPVRINYDSHNGYPFTSISRALIERNLIPREEMSMQRIREWMAAHPDEAAKVRAANRSYVFFRVTGVSNEGEPVGAQGVPLTPGRSIAVDRIHEYGTPFFIEADLPIEGRKPISPFRRLMIAQDTGSAIVGPARADLYWGAGDQAGRIAGRIRHPGRFVMLLPREVDISTAGREPPLPVPKPKIALELGNQDKGKVESVGRSAGGSAIPSPPKPSIIALEFKKRNDRGNTNSANPGGSATGQHKHSALSNGNIVVLEVGKQDGRGKANSASAGASATSKSVVLPALRSKNVATEAKKQPSKAKLETVGASSGAIAAGLHEPPPTPKSKTAESETRKQDGKGKADSDGAGERAAGGMQKPSLAATSKIVRTELKKPKGKRKPEIADEVAVGGKQTPSLAATSKIVRTELKRPKGESKPETAHADEIAVGGKQKPSLVTKAKIPTIEIKKQDAKNEGRAATAGQDRRAAAKSGRQAATGRKNDGS